MKKQNYQTFFFFGTNETSIKITTIKIVYIHKIPPRKVSNLLWSETKKHEEKN